MSRIRRSERYPRYWEYDGRPVLLLGGSVEDNLFQVPDVEAQLDTLAANGGNYVRCTMSSRDEGNVWPFARRADGLYDLDGWADEYWGRFERFLALAEARGIIAQIEVWDRFDHSREPWTLNPFNPANNCNYTREESRLAESYPDHPGRNDQPFFYTVPALQDNEAVLKYQRRFVDRMLAAALPHGNVLYCMDNETSGSPAWGRYWAEYIRAAAAGRGLHVELTEMWDAHDLGDEQHAHTWAHPELYSFVDISQNNHQLGQAHWDNMQAALARLTDPERPANNVKIYGAPGSRHSNETNGQESFWRNVLGGCASARFHRPPSGWGLSERAQAHIRAARTVTDMVDVFECRPRNDLLGERGENAAYCMARPGAEGVVFTTRPDAVVLDTSAFGGGFTVRWMDPDAGEWAGGAEEHGPAASLRLEPPCAPRAVALVKAENGGGLQK